MKHAPGVRVHVEWDAAANLGSASEATAANLRSASPADPGSASTGEHVVGAVAGLRAADDATAANLGSAGAGEHEDDQVAGLGSADEAAAAKMPCAGEAPATGSRPTSFTSSDNFSQ